MGRYISLSTMILLIIPCEALAHGDEAVFYIIAPVVDFIIWFLLLPIVISLANNHRKVKLIISHTVLFILFSTSSWLIVINNYGDIRNMLMPWNYYSSIIEHIVILLLPLITVFYLLFRWK